MEIFTNLSKHIISMVPVCCFDLVDFRYDASIHAYFQNVHKENMHHIIPFSHETKQQNPGENTSANHTDRRGGGVFNPTTHIGNRIDSSALYHNENYLHPELEIFTY